MNRPSPPALGATEVHDVRSAAIDDDLRIFVASCGDDPTSTLVVADGNGLFGLATDVVRLMRIPNLVPAMLVVAIGYPDAPTLVDARRIRMRDLTPTRVSAVPHSGGAENFAGFLADELLPWVSGRFPGATGAVTYFGHSLGGLFGAHLVLTRPSIVTS